LRLGGQHGEESEQEEVEVEIRGEEDGAEDLEAEVVALSDVSTRAPSKLSTALVA
jgi:hypothetical protein